MPVMFRDIAMSGKASASHLTERTCARAKSAGEVKWHAAVKSQYVAHCSACYRMRAPAASDDEVGAGNGLKAERCILKMQTHDRYRCGQEV